MMVRSLNFWLFLVVLICGVSLLLASGVSLPSMGQQEEGTSVVIPSWSNDPEDQPVHLRVLNGTERSGLAREFSLLVSARGCVVEAVGNASGVWTESLLVNRRLESSATAELARQLGGLVVINQWDERVTEDAVLVLGEDYEQIKAALLK